MERFSYKGVCVCVCVLYINIRILRYLKDELSCAIDKWFQVISNEM